MDAFGYLSVLLSIIVGLGVAQVLTALGRLIRHRDRVRVDWLPLLWAAVLLLVYVQVWWAMFGMRRLAEWTFFGFLAVLVPTGTLYMMAAVVLPEQIDAGGVDLRAYYARQHGWFFGLFLATLMASVAKDVVVGGHLPSTTNLAFHTFLSALSVAAILVRARRFQEVVGIAGAGAIALYIGLLFAHLR